MQPGAGRFGSEDGLAYQPGTRSSYAYVDGTPTTYRDPLGAASEVPIGVYTTEWAHSFKLLGRFLLGTGPNYYGYEPTNSRTLAIKNSPGVEAAREKYRKDGCVGLSEFEYKFGLSGLLSSGLNAVRQQVGGYWVWVTPLQHGYAKFTVTNSLTAKSLLYHVDIPENFPRNGPSGPLSRAQPLTDVHEVFSWVEYLPCCEK